MKAKRLIISAELFFTMLQEGFHPGGYSVIENAVPRDAKLINVRHAWPNEIELLISSEGFPEVEEGAEIEAFCPLLRSDCCPDCGTPYFKRPFGEFCCEASKAKADEIMQHYKSIA